MYLSNWIAVGGIGSFDVAFNYFVSSQSGSCAGKKWRSATVDFFYCIYTCYQRIFLSFRGGRRKGLFAP